MATISQRITLEGTEDIRRRLEALGAAGEKAFKQLQDAAKKPIVDPAQIDRSKQSLNQLAVAATQVGDAMAKAGQQAQVAGEQAGSGLQAAAIKFGLASASIVAAIGVIVRSLVSGAGDAAQKLQDDADKLGFTIEQWTALSRGVAAAGNSVDEFANSITPLMANLNRLSLESGTTWTTYADGARVAVITTAKLSDQSKLLVDALVKLGVRRDIIDKGQVAILHDVARIIDDMPEGTQKAAAGVQFFGAKWRSTVEDLTAGLHAMDDTEAQLEQMQRATRELTPEQQKAAREAKNAWEDVGNALLAVRNKIGAFLAPTSAANAKWLSNLIDESRQLFQIWSNLDESGRKLFVANLDAATAGETLFKTLITVGQALASLWSNVLVPLGKTLFNIITALAGPLKELAVAVKDAFQTTGQDAKTPWLTSLGEGIKQLAKEVPDIIKQVGTAIKALGTGLDFIAEKINNMFGTKFTGAGLAAILVLDNMTGALRLQELAITTVAAFLVSINATIMIVVGTIGILNGALTLGSKLWKIFAGTISLVAAAIRGLGAALMFLAANPWSLLVIAAIVAVIAVIFLLIQYWPEIKKAAIDAADGIAAKWQELKALFDAWVATPVANAWQWVTDTFWSSVSFLQTMMDTVTGWIQKWVTTPIANAWQWIKDTFWAVVQGLTSGGGGTPGEQTPVPGMARGGLIGGRGSGTSDSNLAWVSRGEHIMPAAAVRQPGVLAFLEALRRSGGDLSRVLDRMGHFAAGGLVTMPALAGGGLGGMSHVTIQFPGLPAVSGLRASSAVVEELQRSAAMAQVRSGGRKPSRYT